MDKSQIALKKASFLLNLRRVFVDVRGFEGRITTVRKTDSERSRSVFFRLQFLELGD